MKKVGGRKIPRGMEPWNPTFRTARKVGHTASLDNDVGRWGKKSRRPTLPWFPPLRKERARMGHPQLGDADENHRTSQGWATRRSLAVCDEKGRRSETQSLQNPKKERTVESHPSKGAMSGAPGTHSVPIGRILVPCAAIPAILASRDSLVRLSWASSNLGDHNL